MGKLPRADLLAFASLEPGRDLPVAEIVARSGVGGRRTGRSLRRLQRRGLVREGGEETYVTTPRGAHVHGVGTALAMIGEPAFEPPGAMEALCGLALHGDHDQRALAIRAIGNVRRSECTPFLTEVLGEALAREDDGVAAEGVRALVRSRGPEALDALSQAAQRDCPELRVAVADGLGVLRDSRGIDALAELSAHPSPDVRRAAVRALGMVGDPAAVPSLVDRLPDEDSVVRSRARDALIGLGGAQAIAALRTDPRRNRILRRRDANVAGQVPARTGSREVPIRVDGFTSWLWSAAIKGVAVAALLVLLDVWVLHANPVVLAVAATVSAAVVSGWAVRRRRESAVGDQLDVAMGAAEDCPAPTIRSPAMTVVAALGRHPALGVTWLLVLPLGADLVMTGVGVVPGLLAGLLAAVGVERGRDAVRIRRFERSREMRLCTWLVAERRYYCHSSPNPRSAGSHAGP